MKKAIKNARDAFQFKFNETAEEAGFKYVRRCNKNTIMFAEDEEAYYAHIKSSQIIKKVCYILVFLLIALIGESVFFFNFSFERYQYLSSDIIDYWFMATLILLAVIICINYKMERKCNEYEKKYENHRFYDEEENKFYKLERSIYPYPEVVWF